MRRKSSHVAMTTTVRVTVVPAYTFQFVSSSSWIIPVLQMDWCTVSCDLKYDVWRVLLTVTSVDGKNTRVRIVIVFIVSLSCAARPATRLESSATARLTLLSLCVTRLKVYSGRR